ncbi:hypothetical protein EYF80_021628 [Liparis tanakae]|uniref:Uncharacterized protein n=1 Tax=Liparis tanakae TaxID=230148 RepID=A0A4Z2HS77_9TELE|nr:hypothetical protein EYF80_021628 [Liparis tanakae]
MPSSGSSYSGIWDEARPALLFLGLSFFLWAQEVTNGLVLPTERVRMRGPVMLPPPLKIILILNLPRRPSRLRTRFPSRQSPVPTAEHRGGPLLPLVSGLRSPGRRIRGAEWDEGRGCQTVIVTGHWDPAVAGDEGENIVLCVRLLHLILWRAGVTSMGLLATVPPAVWEVVRLSSETAGPEADVPSEDNREVSLSLPPSPSGLTWQWLKAPELDTSSEILSSVDMFMGPCRGGQSDSWKPREGRKRGGSQSSYVGRISFPSSSMMASSSAYLF